MDCQEANYERGIDEQGMVIFSFQLPLRPRDQFMHQPGGIEWSRRFKNHADTSTVLVKSLDVVREFFVLAAMALIARRKFEENSVELLDVVFREGNVRPRIEDHLRGFGIAGNFLFISCLEGAQVKV